MATEEVSFFGILSPSFSSFLGLDSLYLLVAEIEDFV